MVKDLHGAKEPLVVHPVCVLAGNNHGLLLGRLPWVHQCRNPGMLHLILVHFEPALAPKLDALPRALVSLEVDVHSFLRVNHRDNCGDKGVPKLLLHVGHLSELLGGDEVVLLLRALRENVTHPLQSQQAHDGLHLVQLLRPLGVHEDLILRAILGRLVDELHPHVLLLVHRAVHEAAALDREGYALVHVELESVGGVPLKGNGGTVRLLLALYPRLLGDHFRHGHGRPKRPLLELALPRRSGNVPLVAVRQVHHGAMLQSLRAIQELHLPRLARLQEILVLRQPLLVARHPRHLLDGAPQVSQARSVAHLHPLHPVPRPQPHNHIY
mmetsp:Transcript_4064/g.11816  ORF Transcript_4064/g.11816 Transcript_4064/m.11816 type:complete len:327 (-) Transcript_4064:188-1168(-)